MSRHTRSVAVGLSAIVALAGHASAQQITTYGVVEVGSRSSNLELLGASLTTDGMGWKPVVAAMGYHVGYQGGGKNVFAPSVGLMNRMSTGAWQGRVGYSFVDKETSLSSATTAATAGKNGVFGVLQGDYWGKGEALGQIIASYNFADEFLWSRVRGAKRMGASDSPISLGAEVGVMGGGETTKLTSGVTTEKSWAVFGGPILRYRIADNFGITGAAGYRAGSQLFSKSAVYASLDFFYTIPTKR